jgi:hypothetical protein
MPPTRRLPLSRQNKAALVDLARHLGLPTGGTVSDLRSRIRDCLDQNQRILDEDQLNRLFSPRQRVKTNQKLPASPHPRPRAHADTPALLPLIQPGTVGQESARTQQTHSDHDLRHPPWESISQIHSQANSYSVQSQMLEPYLQWDPNSDNPFLESSTSSSSNRLLQELSVTGARQLLPPIVGKHSSPLLIYIVLQMPHIPWCASCANAIFPSPAFDYSLLLYIAMITLRHHMPWIPRLGLSAVQIFFLEIRAFSSYTFMHD